MTAEHLRKVLAYCYPRRTWYREWKRDHDEHVREVQRRYLREHPGHDFTVGTMASRSPVH